MSAADVAVIEAFRSAFLGGDEQAALSLLSPDVEFVRLGTTMRGIEEVRDGYLRGGTMPAQPEDLDVDFDPGTLEDLGDGRVGATNHLVYRSKESGELAYEQHARVEYELREGKIVRYDATVLEDEPGS
jgi:ketosteroid isomerase-like protein